MISSALHIFFFPFLAPGHMIPMVDLAKIFVARNVKVTIITTNANVSLIQPSISQSPHFIQLLTLHLSSPVENLMELPSPKLTPDFVRFIDSLKEPFQQLVIQHHPDFLISDAFYPWTSDLGVPRLFFHGSNAFCMAVYTAISTHKLLESVKNDDEPFIVTGIPHRIEMMKSKLMTNQVTDTNELSRRIVESFKHCYGMIINTVYQFESYYIEMLNVKTWHVGPVSLCNRDMSDKLARGGESREEFVNYSNWLDTKKPGSVLYVCFGSLGRFTSTQLREIAIGLELSGYPFIWVVKNSGDDKDWMPDGVRDNGLIITGWAPQMLILNHEAVGGFMTHCGWNSCIEGASAGLPMITWPLFAEQFFNERLLVDVLKIGLSVGAKVCTYYEEERTLVTSEEVKNAVEELMGVGEEANERRIRVKEVAEMAKKAVEEGGSSYNEMDRLIQELIDVKARKFEQA